MYGQFDSPSEIERVFKGVLYILLLAGARQWLGFEFAALIGLGLLLANVDRIGMELSVVHRHYHKRDVEEAYARDTEEV